jgi:serine/threonine protein kinase
MSNSYNASIEEVRIIAQLEHRNIIPVYDFGEVDDLPYIVMRYMPYGFVGPRLEATD